MQGSLGERGMKREGRDEHNIQLKRKRKKKKEEEKHKSCFGLFSQNFFSLIVCTKIDDFIL